MNSSTVPHIIKLLAPSGLVWAPVVPANGQACFRTPRRPRTVHSMLYGHLLLRGRSLAGLSKKGTDQCMSSKDAGVCLGVDVKHHQFQHSINANSTAFATWLSSCTTTPQLLTPSSLLQFLLPSMDSCVAKTNTFLLPSVMLKLGGSTETLSESYECSVCVQVLKQIMKKWKQINKQKCVVVARKQPSSLVIPWKTGSFFLCCNVLIYNAAQCSFGQGHARALCKGCVGSSMHGEVRPNPQLY